MSFDDNCVYIMTNLSRTVLYVGVTNNLARRVLEHKSGKTGFTARYKVFRLVYYENSGTPMDAINREKQIKGGSRAKKIRLIESMNPEWNDLYNELFGESD